MTDEAKEIVEALRKSACNGCIHNKIGRCMHIQQGKFCGSERHAAADLIEELSADLEAAKEREKGLSIMLTSAQSAAETYKRERDAAVADINMCCSCEVCTRSCTYDKVNPYDECADFEWRGVKNDA